VQLIKRQVAGQNSAAKGIAESIDIGVYAFLLYLRRKDIVSINKIMFFAKAL
jgi:hypothetical protein